MTDVLKGITIRKHADRQVGTRVKRWDPDTGEAFLFNPETGRIEGWPLLGVEWEGDPPTLARVSTTLVDQGAAEGWIRLVEEHVVSRPGGPPSNLWGVTHNFRHAEGIQFNMISGMYYYKVTHQPDKYVEDADDEAEVTTEHYNAGNTRVDWFYDLELNNG